MRGPTSMKRILPAVAVVLAAVLGPVTSTHAAGNANVTLVHGIGPAPEAVDVYVDNALVVADFQYSNQTATTIAEGSHVIMICNHNASPPNPLAGPCPSGSVNSNSGDTVAVIGGRSYTLVAAYAPSGSTEGRPTVVAFQDDLACSSATNARMDIYHAAAFAGAVDFLYQAQVIANAVPPAGVGQASGVPKTADVEVRRDSDSSVLVSQSSVITTAQQLTIKILVGNPQQSAPYALLTRQVPLSGCPTTTTSSTTTSTSTTVKPATVTPRFTG